MDSDEDYEYDTGEDYTYDDDDANDKDDSSSIEEGSDLKDNSMHTSQTSETPKNRLLMAKIGGKLKIPDGSYFISEYASIYQIMESHVNDVASLLDLDPDCAHIMLQNFRWNKEKLMDQFFVTPDKVLEDCGLNLYIPMASNSTSVSSSPTALKSPATDSGVSSVNPEEFFMCRICCDSCSKNDAFSLGCNHMFCRPCYTEYARTQVMDGPSCVFAHCPQHKCNQALTRSHFAYFLSSSHQDTYEKYKVYSVRNFIEMTKGLQYCPAAGCDKVAVGLGVSTVRCSCGSVFCSKCGEEAHEPCTCAQLVDWNQKCMNESETANWILANTK
jgi:ariadne-1